MSKKHHRILIVDDNESIHNDFKSILNPPKIKNDKLESIEKKLFGGKESTSLSCIVYKIDDAYQGEEAIEMVELAEKENYPYSILFMDVRMPPGIDGIQTIKKIWEKQPRLEVVICTAYSDYTWDQMIKELGATDHLLFIKKPFDSTAVKQIAISLTTKSNLAKKNIEHVNNLENKVKKRTEELDMIITKLKDEISLRKEKESELVYLAKHDSLTGLYNRHSFYDILEKIISQYKNNNFSFALFFIDVDNFKPVNDIMGHDIGDRLLIEITKRLKLCLNKYFNISIPNEDNEKEKIFYSDLIFRIGGDEFTAIINLENIQQKKISQKFLDCIDIPYIVNKKKINITCSVGISIFPQDTDNSKNLIKYADTAMYKAKETKGILISFNEIKDKMFLSQLALEEELGSALAKKEITIYYQGLLDKSGKMIGIEALIRWEHPIRGTLKPLEFIYIAEKTGHIIKIGKYILNVACKHLKELHKKGFKNLFVLVNCTIKQFYDPQFINIIESALKTADLEPRYLKLGLEEKFSIEDPERSLSVIKILNKKGIQFTIDGFGKGKSILNFIQNVPKNTIIKIDRTYVKNIVSNINDKDFLYSMLDLIKSKNLNAIVSGIETIEQKDILIQKDCIFQGFYFNKPKPFEDFVKDIEVKLEQ